MPVCAVSCVRTCSPLRVCFCPPQLHGTFRARTIVLSLSECRCMVRLGEPGCVSGCEWGRHSRHMYTHEGVPSSLAIRRSSTRGPGRRPGVGAGCSGRGPRGPGRRHTPPVPRRPPSTQRHPPNLWPELGPHPTAGTHPLEALEMRFLSCCPRKARGFEMGGLQTHHPKG